MSLLKGVPVIARFEEKFEDNIEEKVSIFHKTVVKDNASHSVNYGFDERFHCYYSVDFVVVIFFNGLRVTVALAQNTLLGNDCLPRISDVGDCCKHIKIVAGHKDNSKVAELYKNEHKYVVENDGHNLPVRCAVV